MASEDDTKKAPKPFPWWAILITVIGVAAIAIAIYIYKRRSVAATVNASATVAAGAVAGPNVAPPPNVMGARLNSTVAAPPAGRI
jgi:hypothetical protein